MTTPQLIKLTKQFIAIRSTADNPEALKEAVEFVADIVAKCPNVTIERFEQNGKHSFVAYRGNVRPAKFDILLNAHVDVVPARPDQFKPVEKDGKLYGRGALDMKGTALALTDAFCELANDVPYNLGLQIVSDEEVGGYDGVKLHIDSGVRANFVIMGEYANDRHTIYNAARGLCWAEIAFKGKTAHGGHLWHGANAVVKAGEFAAAVLKRYPTPDKETWTTTASIANLSTPNDAYNKVPDSAILKVDFRFTQEDPVFQSEDSIRTFIASIDPDAVLLNMATFEPAVSVEELNPYVQGLSAAIRKVSGKKARYLGRPAASDGRHFALVNNDIIEFGLYGQQSHSDNEYLELDSIDEYRATLRAFLQKPIPAQLKQSADASQPLHHRLLKKLVAMPTVSKDFTANNHALTFVENFLHNRGMGVKRFEREGFRSIVATTRPGSKRPTVMLSAHIDVVPAEERSFTLQNKNGRLTGRGVMDMKFAIASYLAAVDTLKDHLSSYDFGIMITTDEEVGGRNGVKMLVEEKGYKPKVAIVPDGGENWQLEAFCKGVQWIKLEAAGVSGHASRPWEGDSAINRLLVALHDIKALTPPNPSPRDTFISVGTIEGGTTANQIPTAASAMLDVRTGSLEQHELMFPRIQAICAQHGVTPTLLVNDPPCVNNPDDPYIKPFIDTITTLTGKTHETSYSYGVTDGRFFSAAGVPCIIIEPPAGDRHKETEWLSLEGFNQFHVALEQYLQTVARRTPVVPASRQKEIERLAESLNASDKPAYVWYATFAAGLSHKNFSHYLSGGTPEGAAHTYKGCRNPSEPLKDVFISLPYELYFAGESKVWGGGLATLDTTRTPRARTIARAYLVTVEQLEDLAAQENWQDTPVRLPLAKAMQQGHATIDDAKDSPYSVYNELLYCGVRDGYPIFTLTGIRSRTPYIPPSEAYTRILCAGLAEDARMDAEAAIDYVVTRPGIAGHYGKTALAKLFKEAGGAPDPAADKA